MKLNLAIQNCGGALDNSSCPETCANHVMDQKPSKDMEVCPEEKRDDSPDLLELASNNDLDSFRWHVEKGSMKVDAVGNWYTRENGTRKMVLEERTPLMIAAMYGSLDVLKYIVEMYAKVGGDINQACGRDQSTALHCAASGGSIFAEETVRFLLHSGSNPHLTDVHRRRAADVLSVMDRSGNAKRILEELMEKEKPKLVSDENLCKGKMCNLRTESEEVSGKAKACIAEIELGAVVDKKPLDSSIDFSDLLLETCFLPSSFEDVGLIAPIESNEDSDTSVSSSTLSIASSGSYPSSLSSPSSSPTSPKNYMAKAFPKASADGTEKVKEYLYDPSLPDIKSNIYSTDEFRMYSFKIRPCSRAYSHDWTECPFAHPGENARRRDPRRYHYSCVPCPDFRKGECQHGDACEYAHGVFECWLHPAQYRTRLCKDGKECNRRVCFFAHVVEELRPLYLSTGSAIPSPKSSGFADISPMDSPRAAASVMLMMQPPFSASLSHNNVMHGSLATPPMSPSVPSMHLSGGATHASSGGNSRLRPTSKADDSSLTDLLISPDINSRWLNEFQSFSASGQSLSAQARVNAAMAASRNRSFSGSFRNMERNTVASMNLDKSRSGSLSRSFRSLEHSIPPTNLDDLFAMESISSPHSPMTREPLSLLDRQYAGMKSACHQAHIQGEMQGQREMQAQRLSAAEGQLKSPHLLSPKTPKTALFAQMATTYGSVKVDSHGFDEVHTPTRGITPNSLGLDCSLPDWAVNGDRYSRIRSSISPAFGDVEEPDLSWIQKLVKEEPLDSPASYATCDDVQMENSNIDLSSWVEKLHLDEKWPVRISAPKQVL